MNTSNDEFSSVNVHSPLWLLGIATLNVAPLSQALILKWKDINSTPESETRSDVQQLTTIHLSSSLRRWMYSGSPTFGLHTRKIPSPLIGVYSNPLTRSITFIPRQSNTPSLRATRSNSNLRTSPRGQQNIFTISTSQIKVVDRF